MSANIMYQPVSGKDLSVGAPSSFLAALAEAGYQQPFVLTDRDASTLMGLRAGLTSTDQKDAITELMEAAMKHGEIRVWAEY